jgi:hypothetical protein
MDISAEKHGISGNHRADIFSAVLQTVLGLARRLIGFFTVTEADRTKAGIYIRRDGA